MTVLPDRTLKLMSPKDRKYLGKAGVTAQEATAKAEVKTERELQNQIANYLRLHGIWFDCDSMAHKRKGTKGAPDFLLAVKGHAVAIEAKTATGKLSGDQVNAAEAMRANGWHVIVARSLADVQKLLREIDSLKEV